MKDESLPNAPTPTPHPHFKAKQKYMGPKPSRTSKQNNHVCCMVYTCLQFSALIKSSTGIRMVMWARKKKIFQILPSSSQSM